MTAYRERAHLARTEGEGARGRTGWGAKRQELKWMLVSNVLATLLFFCEQNRVK